MDSSGIYASALVDGLTRRIDFASDKFGVLLVTSAYKFNRAHRRRSDISNEVVAEGYAPGGILAAVKLASDDILGRIDITLGAARWDDSSIAARGAVYYKRRGGKPADDELIAYIHQASTVVSQNGPWTLPESILRLSL